jgi:hypothetical protein
MTEDTFVCRSCCKPRKNSEKARRVGKRWRCRGCEDGRNQAMRARQDRTRDAACT